jgi:hypothetical protein
MLQLRRSEFTHHSSNPKKNEKHKSRQKNFPFFRFSKDRILGEFSKTVLLLFNVPLQKLDLSKLDVDSGDYDPVYEAQVRRDDTLVLFYLDDLLLKLADVDYNVSGCVFALENTFFSKTLYKEALFEEKIDNSFVLDALLSALHNSASMLCLLQNGGRLSLEATQSMADLYRLLVSPYWRNLEKSQGISECLRPVSQTL